MLEAGRDAMLALAERCEKATGPDREIDKAILLALGYSWRGMGYWYRDDSHQWSWPTHFTASLDTAMTLLDRHGVLLHLSDIGADGLPYARVGRPDLADAPIFTGISSGIAKNATPTSGLALALTAAALRARSRAGGLA